MVGLPVFDILIGVLDLYLIKYYLSLRRQNLPPGPKRLPIIGNLLDMPKSYDWLHWAKHKNTYGPISSVTVFGQNMVIINDAQIAFYLFEKRSPIYSDRPTFVFAGEMCGWKDILGFLHYGETLRAHRRNIHRILGSRNAISSTFPLEEVETRRFLTRVADSPNKLSSHIRTLAGAIILKISYGYAIKLQGSDPLVDLADKAMNQVSQALIPGAWLVDSLPILKSLPDWLPGSGFKGTAREWHKTLTEMVEKPHALVRNQMATGTAAPSYTSTLLEGAATAEEEDIVKWSAASLYAAGSDTTVAAIYSFFLAMVLYPEVQKRAQDELDAVTGGDRLPTFKDRPKLPYIEAVVKEVLRWHSITPLGIAHTNTEDDIYNGYTIPKGTILLANIWQMSHDPENYHKSTEFKPERFLGVDGSAPEIDPHKLIFGFGRRICAGKVLADATVFIAIAMSLAVFNITKPRDRSGEEIEPLNESTSGFISHLKEYNCGIAPRSAKATALIHSRDDEHMLAKSDSDALKNLHWKPMRSTGTVE